MSVLLGNRHFIAEDCTYSGNGYFSSFVQCIHSQECSKQEISLVHWVGEGDKESWQAKCFLLVNELKDTWKTAYFE